MHHTLRSSVAFLFVSLSLSTVGCADPNPEPEPEENLEVAVAELGWSCTAKKLEPGVFSTGADEGRIVFSLDGRDAYFHRTVDGVFTLFESHRHAGAWSTPTPLLSSGFGEEDPFLTLDGRTLYFSSFRPIPGATAPRGDADIWKVERAGAGWGAPIYLADINTEDMELFASVTADGTLYFNSQRPGGAGAWDIYAARKRGAGFFPPQPLPGSVNTAIWEYNPSLSPGGLLLAFGSLDPDPAAPYSDIFFSVKRHGAYEPRIAAGPCVNTVLEEFHPTLDVARHRLVFVRSDPFKVPYVPDGDFYEVDLPEALWGQ